jgi:quinoprotein glucose dehydrogenase
MMPFPMTSRRTFLQTTLFGAAAARAAQTSPWEWQHYGGDAGATRYAPLGQINRSNVKHLRPAWTHRTGDASQRPVTTIECTPIVVDGVMYLTTAQLRVQALDAATGKLLWTFDPLAGRRRRPGVNRGVTFWQDPANPKVRRIYAPLRDQLFCLDAATGKPAPGFGNEGALDLKKDFDADRPELPMKITSPVVMFRDLVITGGGGGDGADQQAPGHIRAFDARTGKRRWIFHTIPKPGEFGHDTWGGDSWKRAGGANNWGGLSLDVKRGWVFVSTGSPAFDYYGGDRKGTNLFGNCVIALEAATGQRIWHYQLVHHDVWDYDLPCQPALITVRRGGRTIDAVAQVTKMGLVFLFERESGKPLFPIEERPIAKSDVAGEELWPTQPFPRKPPPLNRLAFTEGEITNLSPESHAAVKEIWSRSRAGAIYTPPSKQGTIVHPGFRGGVLWGGASFDPKLNYLFVNSDENTNRITLAEAGEGKPYPYELPERIRLYDPEGYPAIKPPWGYLTAIDLESGEFAWRVVTGEFPELKARGLPKTGTPSNGGTLATAGGLVFFAGTFDEKIRAFDSKTGEALWEHSLEAAGFATPCTYDVNGKQYVVIAAGGGKGFTRPGDQFVAFALPG